MVDREYEGVVRECYLKGASDRHGRFACWRGERVIEIR